jgi:AraC family transcriptional regulator, arabinose operon regulatory protein
MKPRLPTPHVHPPLIVTGHFHRGPRYSAWRPTGTDDWLLIYTVNGQGLFRVGESSIQSAPGDAVLLRPGTPHDYRTDPAVRRWELIWAHFHPRPAWLPWMGWPIEAPGLMRLTLPAGAARRDGHGFIDDMHRRSIRSLARADEWAMNALEAFLLHADYHNPLRAHQQIDPRLQRAVDYACAHLGHDLPMHRLAMVSHLSVSRFAHLFRQQLGRSPQAFIERQRLVRAAQLLRTTAMAVQEVALEVGFSNPFYFSLRFRRMHGQSPRQFRQAGRGGEAGFATHRRPL